MFIHRVCKKRLIMNLALHIQVVHKTFNFEPDCIQNVQKTFNIEPDCIQDVQKTFKC